MHRDFASNTVRKGADFECLTLPSKSVNNLIRLLAKVTIPVLLCSELLLGMTGSWH